ncbi:phage head closure protein [Phyllobacterium sp. YR531]|uniref:phage head closure protein n=1 Tax=Phyllobacterium sp. YR531 TaxID=1144343 RepID=UPI00026F9035|nr:phage head closure protein [Phyllobacterium sp. YR531]EJN01412.1 phage head-tail adaptor, putative, SPP1 family [Phyllobacterium sp. YR531]
MPTLFIDPGSLNQELLLEEPLVSFGGVGDLHELWSEVSSLWAQLEHAGAGPRILGEQELPEVTYRITFRYRPDISSTMRFRKGERVFRILTLHDPDETGRYLVARVSEEVQ